MTKEECIKILEEFELGSYVICRVCIQTRLNKLTCKNCNYQKSIQKAIKLLKEK